MKDKARFQERSPINFVDQIKAPLLAVGRRQRSSLP